MSGLETEAEWVKHFRDRSGIKNPQNLIDSQGRPTSSNSLYFADGKEYLEELVSKRLDAYGPRGLIEIAKEKLRTAKSDWQYRMDARNTPDVKPKGQAAITINMLNARLKVYREEARKINSEISKEYKADDLKLKKLQKKFRFKGLRKRKNNEVWQCDFRLVENRKFTDNGESLDEYLIEVKSRKRAKSLALRQIEKEHMEKVEKDRLNKIAIKKKKVDEAISKLKRRRPPQQPAA